MLNRQKFGEYLKKRRRIKGLTITELSRLSKVSQPYLWQIERGDRFPSLKVVKKLAIALHISYIELMMAAGYWPGNIKEYPDDLCAVLHDDRLEFKGNLLTEKQRKQILDILYIVFSEEEVVNETT